MPDPASRGPITNQPAEKRVLDAGVTFEVARAHEPANADHVPLSPEAVQVIETFLEVAERRVKCRGCGAKNAKRLRCTFSNQIKENSTPGSRSRPAEVLDGHTRIARHSLEELKTYWQPVLERVSSAPGPTLKVLNDLKRREVADFAKPWTPITVKEVKASRIDLRTAPGPDGIRSEEWRTVPLTLKAEMFNHWMARFAPTVQDNLHTEYGCP
ncbi:unnamed protein product [Euphydryas editha]|uniref:Uncharacterized protein n=1 Tax=Euphydryas editha TaxID=104508 RepID=A0AAU9TA07_EUPED|nr:unnamed protein product [Euphydryas editha]